MSSVISGISGTSLSFGTLGNFTAQGAFTLATTYTGLITGPATMTLILAQTRARVLCSMQAYVFPTTVSFSQPALIIGAATSITATAGSAILAGTAWLVTATSGTVTSGSGTTGSAGLTVPFTFNPSMTAPATGALRLTWASIVRTLSATLPAARRVISSYTGSLEGSKAGTLTVTMSPTTGITNGASARAYYSASSTDASPTQCGTGTCTSAGVATVTCTMPIGTYYLFTSLDVDAYMISQAAATPLVVAVAVDWTGYILYNQPKIANPGWEKQLASFARPSEYAYSSAYATFIKAVVDNTMYQTTSGVEWNSSTGSLGDMMLKPENYGEQADPGLVKNVPTAFCYVAPISSLTGSGLTPLTAQNGTAYEQYWDSSSSGFPRPFIRWGYKVPVTARSWGICMTQRASWFGRTLTLMGFPSRSFSSGTVLATKVVDSSCNLSNTGDNYSWFTIGAPASFAYYEFFANGHHDSGKYAWPIILAST